MTTDSDLKRLVRARMAETGEPYTAALAALRAEREAAEAFWARTVRIFLPDGRLTSVPVRRKARIVVLLELLRRFEPGRGYPEREVNDILREAHDDVAYLRREMVDYGFMTRDASVYRVADAFPDHDPIPAQDMPADAARRFREATRRPASDVSR